MACELIGTLVLTKFEIGWESAPSVNENTVLDGDCDRDGVIDCSLDPVAIENALVCVAGTFVAGIPLAEFVTK